MTKRKSYLPVKRHDVPVSKEQFRRGQAHNDGGVHWRGDDGWTHRQQMLLMLTLSLIGAGLVVQDFYVRNQGSLPTPSDESLKSTAGSSVAFFPVASSSQAANPVSTAHSRLREYPGFQPTYFQKRTAPAVPIKLPYDEFFLRFIRENLGLHTKNTNFRDWFDISRRDNEIVDRFAAHKVRFTPEGYAKRVVASALYFDLSDIKLNPCKEIQDLQVLSAYLRKAWYWLVSAEGSNLFTLDAENIKAMKEVYLSLLEKPLPQGSAAFNLSAKRYWSLMQVFIAVCDKTLDYAENTPWITKRRPEAIFAQFNKQIDLAAQKAELEHQARKQDECQTVASMSP